MHWACALFDKHDVPCTHCVYDELENTFGGKFGAECDLQSVMCRTCLLEIWVLLHIASMT